jgi:hypothetical protein
VDNKLGTSKVGCSRSTQAWLKKSATITSEEIFMTEQKPKGKETATDSTVSVQLAALTLELAKVKKDLEAKTEENTALRKQNIELASVIETDLKADLKMKIMAKSDYKEADLEPLKVEQLQQIDETLSKSKGADSITYKPIRAGSDAEGTGRTTVGNLYGKSREEILKMGGNF